MSIAHDPSLRIPPSSLPLRLQQAREWRNLNQVDLAEALDVSRATISNYERGVSSPSKLQVNAWAAFCDVDVEWLKSGLEPTGTPDDGGTRASAVGPTGLEPMTSTVEGGRSAVISILSKKAA